MLIKRPHVTEKTMKLAEEQNRYTFLVSSSANKLTATTELESRFGVTVTGVTVTNRLGKEKRFGKQRNAGMRANNKFMVFALKSGDKIEAFTSK